MIIVSILLFIGSIKTSMSISSHTEDFISNGISKQELLALKVSVWSYLIPLVIMNMPFKALAFLVYPIPILLLLVLPGFIKSKNLSAVLEISGTDRGALAGRVAGNAMWLGIAMGIIILWSWGWSLAILLIFRTSS